MIFLANLLAGVIVLAFIFFLKFIEFAFGLPIMLAFIFGWVGASLFWQAVYKSVHGYWFTPPTIDPDN